ncbi:MAG: hypothetical protein MJE68_21045 [Proteobacteria bacterium]|nr:hypothetical protein [Pseudomonadota bacterium]
MGVKERVRGHQGKIKEVRERERERERDRQTDRERERHTIALYYRKQCVNGRDRWKENKERERKRG